LKTKLTLKCESKEKVPTEERWQITPWVEFRKKPTTNEITLTKILCALPVAQAAHH
jgi:hypothetical protein